MEAPWGFRSVEQNANATVGPGKTNNYSGLTTAPGTTFDTQPGEPESGSQLEIQVSFDGHLSHLRVSHRGLK
jgi:hypothetical protein